MRKPKKTPDPFSPRVLVGGAPDSAGARGDLRRRRQARRPAARLSRRRQHHARVPASGYPLSSRHRRRRPAGRLRRPGIAEAIAAARGGCAGVWIAGPRTRACPVAAPLNCRIPDGRWTFSVHRSSQLFLRHSFCNRAILQFCNPFRVTQPWHLRLLKRRYNRRLSSAVSGGSDDEASDVYRGPRDRARRGQCVGTAAAGRSWRGAGHTAPKTQPTTAPDPTIAAGDLALGSVSLGKAVKADGKPLPAGTYQVRLTAEQASSAAPGQTKASERWVEFVRGGKVVGREVVTIVPQAEIAPGPEGHAAGPKRREGRNAQGRRLRSRLDQSRRELLPDSPAGVDG